MKILLLKSQHLCPLTSVEQKKHFQTLSRHPGMNFETISIRTCQHLSILVFKLAEQQPGCEKNMNIFPWFSWPACWRNRNLDVTRIFFIWQNTILSSSAHLRAYLRATRSNGEIYTTREIYGVQEARPDCTPTTSTAQPVRAAAVSYRAFAPSAWSVRESSSRRVNGGRPDSVYDFQIIY